MIGEEVILDFFESFGPLALALLSFTEAIIQPIPPDVLFLPMAYDARDNETLLIWLWLVVTVSSVFGAIIGHALGKRYGSKLVDKFGKPHHRQQLEKMFERYGTLGMFIAAVSPLPYKVFGWIAGASDMKLRPFIIAGIFGRGLRFGLEALFIFMYGESAIKAVEWVLERELLMGIILVLTLTAVIWWLMRTNTSPVHQE
ncbi:DedA family protein [Candidatus Poseidoniales archaeon]|nr:DedA family protein [Candidatus Poseidoniales archaeon]|tara:strand:- start:806 stop:1405 length:600 start_codon:yes stop_codon:yes gene_type:complete